MTEAPFVLGARCDATSAEVVVGFPDRDEVCLALGLALYLEVIDAPAFRTRGMR